MTKRSRIFTFCVAGLVFLTGCDAASRLKDSAAGAVVQFIPRKVDRTIGELARKADPRFSADEAKQNAESLNTLLQPLTDVSKIEGLTIQFSILDAREPNAFALPDGSIFFTSKLIRMSETPEEILAVAGHELAHVHLRHGMLQLVTRAALSVFVQILFGDLGGIADLLHAGAQLANLKFSRDHERQADLKGTELLKKANLPQTGALAFFKRMKAYEQELSRNPSGAELSSILSTHPQTAERISWAEQLPEDPKAQLSNDMQRAFSQLKSEYK